MQRFRFIKGKAYLIEGIPHLYQGTENGIYKFLKIDGTQKYIYENNLDKVKLTLQDEMYEQKLKSAEDKILYYKEKEEQKAIKNKYAAAKRRSWLSDSGFVQISAGLTMVVITIVGLRAAIESGRKSESFAVGLLTFVVIIISGSIVSLLIGWLAYKAEEFVDEEKKLNLLIKLLFYIPVVWFLLFKLYQLLFLSQTDNEG